MFVNNFALFNEESGEMSFSALARAVTGHTNKSEFAHINALYILLHQYVRIDDEVKKDRNTKAMRNGFVKVDDNGAGVQAARVFLVGHLQTIERNQFRVYGGKAMKANPAFESQRAGIVSLTVAQERKPMWIPDIRPLLAKKWKSIKKKLNTNWGFHVAHVFPEFATFNRRRFLAQAAVIEEQKGGPALDYDQESTSSEALSDDDGGGLSIAPSSSEDSEDIGEMKEKPRHRNEEGEWLLNGDSNSETEDEQGDKEPSVVRGAISTDLLRQATLAAQPSSELAFANLPQIQPKPRGSKRRR